MEKNPYKEDQEKASEYLRLAIALLAKHQIPVTPPNYRLGYDAVSGRSNELDKTLVEDGVASEIALSERMWVLHQSLYTLTDESLDKIRQELSGIVNGLQGVLRLSGDKVSAYSDRLNQFAAVLNSSMAPQALEAEVKAVKDDTQEVALSQRELTAQLNQVTNDMDALRKELAQIRDESYKDFLTGVSNRKAFDAALEDIIYNTRVEKSTFSILLADIDHFKKVNDSYGHLIGDKVLRFVASTLKRSVKGKDIVARFGGEEFSVILPNTDITGAYAVAEQIRRAVSAGKIKDMNNQTLLEKITISIGIAQYDVRDQQNDLIQRADEALYKAKENGRNRIEAIK